MRRLWAILKRDLRVHARDDRGQTVLIVAAVLMGVALTAAAVFLNLDAGKRIIERLKSGNARQASAGPALIAYYLKSSGTNGADGFLPCPDSKDTPDGNAGPTSGVGGSPTAATMHTFCDGTTHPNVGVLPWKDLGLSRDQAIDAQGNFYTYVVSKDSVQVCRQITPDYGSSGAALTGTLNSTAASINVQTVSSTSLVDTGQKVPFAIIGHGLNKLGARSYSGNKDLTDALSVGEVANAHPHKGAAASKTAIASGPYTGPDGQSTDGSSSTAFDDQVYIPTTAALEKMCLSLAGKTSVNATLNESFGDNNGAFNAAKVDTGQSDATVAFAQHSVNGTATNTSNYVANFAGAQALFTNAANYIFNPTVLPVHVEAIWTPGRTLNSTVCAADPGMSIATRVTPADRTASSDIFGANNAHGITFRYFSTGFGTNTISIRDQSGVLVSSATNTNTADQNYTLICEKTYRIEAYDDGNRVWARITQTDDPTNYAMVSTSGITSDLDGDNRVAFIGGGTHVNYIDDVVIGPAMLSVETAVNPDATSSTNFDGNRGVISAGQQLLTTLTSAATFEAMVRPRAYPSTTASKAVIMGQWSEADTAATPQNNSFRVYITPTGAVGVDLAGGKANGGSAADTNVNESHTFGAVPLDEWTMVSVVYSNSAQTVSVYLNGVLSGTATTTITTSLALPATSRGIFAGTHNFYAGADGSGNAHYFTGDIADVRYWDGARTVANIASTYRTRLSYLTTGVTELDAASSNIHLRLNWKLDADPYNSDVNITSTTANNTGVDTGSYSPPAGTLTGATAATSARYVASLSAFLPPFADDVCPASSIAGLRQCDFRNRSSNVFVGLAANMLIPANLQSVYAKLWGGGGGGFTGGKIYATNTRTTPSLIGTKYLRFAVGGAGIGNASTALNGAGGGGATAVSLADTAGAATASVLLAAGGGGGASYSNQTGITSFIQCSTAAGTTNQCGLGAGGGGAIDAITAATNAPTRAPDASATLCGGKPGTLAAASYGTDPTNMFCSSGGIAPTNGATGGTGSGTATGGAARVNNTAGLGSGGAGYDGVAGTVAIPGTGIAGAGGGGGGVYTVDASFVPATGGAGAGGYERFSSTTITVNTAPADGDTIRVTFSNSSYTPTTVTASYPVSGTITANTLATNLASQIAGTSSGFGLSAYVDATLLNTVHVLQHGDRSELTTAADATLFGATGHASTTLDLSAACTGNVVGTITVVGPVAIGDTITANFTNPTLSATSAAAVNGDGPTQLATKLATAINGLSNFSTGLTGAVITVSNSACNTGTPTTVTTVTSATSPISISPTTLATSGTSNGFGGGGGGGFAQASPYVRNAAGQAGLTDLYGRAGRSSGYGTATITIPGAPTGTQTVALAFRNTAPTTPTTLVTITSAALTGASTPTSVAADLVTQINADTTLRAAGITASNAAGVITYRWTGTASYNPYSVDVRATVSDGSIATVAFYPGATTATTATSVSASGYTTGYDYYYSPSYATGVSATPAAGGSRGLSGTSGPDGRPGAAVIIW